MDWLRRNPLLGVLALVCLLLAAAIGVEAELGANLRDAMRPASGKPALPVEAKLLPPLLATAAEQAYPETVARPLFIPTRRPAPVVVAVPQSTFQKGQFVLAGVIVALFVTHTTLNVQSLMGAIMSIGVSVANAVLLVGFAKEAWQAGATQRDAVVASARGRLRPILMTSLAMVAGMVPTAMALGEGGEQSAPLGRAVIGGLVASTVATLLFLPALYAILARRGTARSGSLDPDDPARTHAQLGPVPETAS